ncbi:unnamed protein product [Coffea canephora]|uniref:DH200=94 genomic scaffold, scaffold_189 n=1 Tax=Coffea canephora TaxID=49390 RepID=A0A068VAQ3_COFCA|nr:unnamed protein product [Coffea canephora]
MKLLIITSSKQVRPATKTIPKFQKFCSLPWNELAYSSPLFHLFFFLYSRTNKLHARLNPLI